MPIDIQPVTENDISFVFEAIKNLAEVNGYMCETNQEKIKLGILSNNKYCDGLVAWYDSKRVGYVSYSFEYMTRLGRPIFRFRDLWVVPSSRRIGVATKLMDKLFSIAIEHNAYTIEFYISPANDKAKFFYNKLNASREIAESWRFNVDSIKKEL